MKTFSVAELVLDQSNPRFPPTKSQKEAIAVLLADDPPKLLNLAQDISATGQLNPLDTICVVYEHGIPVVAEGNRRVATLKLLRRPALASHRSDVDAFKDMAKVGKGPDSISCFVAASRDDARHWIELRHRGENEGRGIRPWSAEQANRFRRAPGSQADKASRFCDAVLAEFPADLALAADVALVRQARLTTLGRLVADTTVAHAFGFRFTKDDVVFEFESRDLVDGLRRLFQDLKGDRGSVSRIKNKNDRVDYVKETAAVQPPISKRLRSPRLPGTSSTAQPSGRPTSTSTRGTGKPPVKPESVIFEGLKMTHCSTRTQNLMKAVQSLRIDDHVPICAVMLRVVIELIVTEVGVPRRWLKETDAFATKIRKVLLRLDPDCEKPRQRIKSLEAAWTTSQSDAGGNGIGIEQMHSYVHNVMSHPDAATVRAVSANFRPMLEQLNTYEATHA